MAAQRLIEGMARGFATQVDRAGIEVDFIPTQHDEFLDVYARQQRNYHQPDLHLSRRSQAR
jgi:hypothetical protein